ncbi:MAG: tagatose 1,6-diphosphate aldolase [Anaerolineae bacterium]
MAQEITVGRWQGLKRSSIDGDLFTILAFDQRGTYRRMLPENTTYETAVDIKREVVTALSPHASAVLLDTDYGLPSAMYLARSSGILMALERSGYSGDSTYRRIEFDPKWSVAKIKRMGASAVKLLAYYHPYSGALAEEIEGVVRSVADECHRFDLPLFLEPISYSLDATISKESAEFAQTRPEVVRETAERLSKTGADILKMEFPVDAAFDSDMRSWEAACTAVSKASVVPWVLLSAGVDFETFAEQTRIACQSGASGFLAGRAIWKEAVTMSHTERVQFLAEKGTERLYRLSKIALENARPWTDFYSPPRAKRTWAQDYSEF